ncbi:MAG: hypothetical protein ABFE07_00320 [Armatimonadia bacterium]
MKLHLPDANVNAGSHNKKIQQIKELSESGDVTGLLGLQVGQNTYGKIQANLINMLLEKHGSPHKVVPGQKAGEHAAVQGTQEVAKEAESDAKLKEIDAQHVNAPIPPKQKAMLDKWAAEGDKESLEYTVGANQKTNPHIAAYAQKLADSLPDAPAEATAPAAEEGPKEGETKQGADGTLVFKDGRWHKQEQAKPAAEHPSQAQDFGMFAGLQVDVDEAITDGDTSKLNDIETYLTHPQNKNEPGAAAMLAYIKAQESKSNRSAEPTPAPVPAKRAAEPKSSGKQDASLGLPVFEEGKNTKGVKAYYDKLAAKIAAMAVAGDVQGLKDMVKPDSGNTWKGKTKNSKTLMAWHADAVKHAEGKSTTADQPASGVSAESVPAPAAPAAEASPKKSADKYSEENDDGSPKLTDKGILMGAGGYGKTFANLTQAQNAADKWAAKGYQTKVIGLHPYFVHIEKPTAPVAAPATPASDAAGKLAQIPWDTQLLPDSNSNAKSHNGQVAKIKAMAEAGDLEGLKAFKAGKNTYGQKQMKLAAVAIAALKEAGPAAAPAASAPQIKVKGVEYTKQADGSWSSSEGIASPSSPMGIALAMVNGEKPDLSAKTDIQKEVISELMVEAGAKPEKALSAVYGSGDDGPKEGDTKEINGVTYKLINGRWHKVSSDPTPEEKAKIVAWLNAPEGDEHNHAEGESLYGKLSEEQQLAILNEENGTSDQQEEADATHPIDAVPEPDMSTFSLGNQVTIKQALGQLKEQLKAGNLDVLKGITKKMKSGKLVVKLPTANGYIKVNMYQSSASGQSMLAHIDALKGAAGKPQKTPKPKAAPAAAAAPAAPDHSGIESMDAWTQTGPQGGSNPGGRFKDADGVEWYCKFPGDEDVAKSEVLAAQLYALAGVAGQDAKLITKGGKLGIASRWVDVKKASGPSHLSGVDGVQAGFAVDAWLGNWDVVGLSYDNLQIGADGKAVRVDAGGSLQYRAQGGKKAFGNTVGEIDSLRDPKVNPQAAAVFGSMTNADITASVKKVAEISDDDIYDLVMKHGPGDHENKAHLIETLIERKNDLLAKFPKAVKKEKAKPKPDPTKLKVDTSQLPKPHDFHNWNGAGKGLSSKAHVNDMNLKAEQDLLAKAAEGNLIALKDYHFEAVDKETGASLGQKPIEEHPSQHVKLYWSDLVSTLSYIAYPPEALKKFKSVVAGSIKKISDAFKSQSYGVTTNKVEANSRLAFWIALGHTKPVEALLPPGKTTQFESEPAGVPAMTSAMKSAAKTAYAALGSGRLVKRFINRIQASGTYNDNFRDGKMITSDGKDAVGMVLDAYDFATEKPEGFEIYKWMSFSGDMGKQLLNAPPGTVFQNPGSMCCSYMPNATSGFGADRVRIRYAKGAKAVDSFGSGSFSSEKEITTLPGQRFVILSCKKVHCPVKGKERIELDVMMLPPDESYVAELQAQKGIHGQAAA